MSKSDKPLYFSAEASIDLDSCIEALVQAGALVASNAEEENEMSKLSAVSMQNGDTTRSLVTQNTPEEVTRSLPQVNPQNKHNSILSEQLNEKTKQLQDTTLLLQSTQQQLSEANTKIQGNTLLLDQCRKEIEELKLELLSKQETIQVYGEELHEANIKHKCIQEELNQPSKAKKKIKSFKILL